MIINFIALALLAFIIYFGNYYYTIAKIGAGYKAKILCSAVFVSKRNPEEAIKNDLSFSVLHFFNYKVDYKARSVTCSLLWGLIKRKAQFFPSHGAVLDADPNSFIDKIIPESKNDSLEGDSILYTSEKFNEINYFHLNKIIDEQFIEKDSLRVLKTEAVIILYKGKIIGEKYSNSANAESRLCGWSMTKTFANALTAILINKGFVKVEDRFNLSYWKDDPAKKEITLDNILRMNAGLEFRESYKEFDSDAIKMLYLYNDSAKYAANSKTIYKPGTVWNYSSGSSNLLSQFLKEKLLERNLDPYNFTHSELLDKIGMNSSVVETDLSGTMLLSSGLYATAHQWARLGKLYLQNGIWNGENLFPDWWMKYSTTRTVSSRFQKFGAHIWVKPNGSKRESRLPFIELLPDDLFFATGHYGQYLFIVPSKNLVVLRLGQTEKSDYFNEYKFLIDICKTVT
ncbi:MAG: beta-lactamase family protein [Melioribacteraceae bacterium]|nr:beta-lactamase family protein [Melioribacteraceae bacterium]